MDSSFASLGLAPNVLARLSEMGVTAPTPIQARAIPIAMRGGDVVGIAQTGTGKTYAFGLPMLQRLASGPGMGLILVPTRELAQQVSDSLAPFGRSLGLSGVILIGGASMGNQIRDLRSKPRVIIATPGRLIDHMHEGHVRLNDIRVLILDEADRMLDMGFQPQIREILAALPRERQTMLFSATLSREIMSLANAHLQTPTSIEVSPPGTTADKVAQEFFIVRKAEKLQLLERVLGEVPGSTIVFSRTKHGAKKIAHIVSGMGHHAAEIHANRTLAQRKQALEGFKTGKYRVLVATDIAARGIDVKNIALVINYDMPSKTEDYVHRIGRTARAGAEGRAISFVMPEEKRELYHIERLIRREVRVTPTPKLPPPRAVPPHESEAHTPRRHQPASRWGQRRRR
jgi:ATP-dependent RNA helicase RhlE